MNPESHLHPAYKPSAVEWLGDIPAHWDVRRAKYFYREVDERSVTGLEELMSVSHKTGVTPRKSTVTMFMAESNVDYKVCRPGDIVINTMWAYMAALGVARQVGVVSPSYGVYRPRSGSPLNSDYVEPLLRTETYRTEYLRRSTGITSSRLRLYPDQFLGIPLLCPPITEQTAIVHYLDRADEGIRRAISAKERLIELLTEQRQAVIHRAVTRGLDPNVQLKDSGVEWLGDVPAHWEVEHAKWLFSKMDRPVQEQDDVVTCFRDGVVTLRKNRRELGFTESIKEIGYQGIRRGDLVIHTMDAFAGAIGVADSDGKGTPVYSVCKPATRANAYYYAYALREMARSKWIQALAKGIRQRSSDFRYADFGAQPVPVPPPAEQFDIARYLDKITADIDTAIDKAQRQIDLLREYRTRLIADVVTGQVDVRGAVGDEVELPVS